MEEYLRLTCIDECHNSNRNIHLQKMASVTAPDSKMKSFCVVTGAGRGIGRATAKALAKNFAADSVLVLTDILPAELI